MGERYEERASALHCYVRSDVVGREDFYKSTFIECAGNSQRKKHFQCRMCVFSHEYQSRCKRHFLERHYKRSVEFGNYVCLPCCIDHKDGSSGKPHFHCPVCDNTFWPNRFTPHLEQHTSRCNEESSNQHPLNDEIKKSTSGNQKYAECPVCQKVMSSRSIPNHCRTIHGIETENVANCIDHRKGIYLVRLSSHGGIPYPVHIRKNVSEFHAGESAVECENSECMDYMRIMWKSGFPAAQCRHLCTVPTNIVYPSSVELTDANLMSLSSSGSYKILKDSKINGCRELAQKSSNAQSPLVQAVHHGRYIMISVFTPEKHYYSRLGRILVTVDLKPGHLSCRCCDAKMYCIHKCISLWYLAEKGLIDCFNGQDLVIDELNEQQEEIFAVSDQHEQEHIDQQLVYPPKESEVLKKMCTYISSKKRIPNSSQIRLLAKNIPKELHPTETECAECNTKLSGSLLITRNAKILTMDMMIENICTFYRKCPNCNICYRYQEHDLGIHNFSDVFLVAIDVCCHIKDSLRQFIPIGSTAKVLSLRIGKTVLAQQLINAYLHFDTLFDAHDYSFNCDICGHFPTIVIMDLCKKIHFRCKASYLSPSELEEVDVVDSDEYWGKVENNMVLRGFPQRSIPEWEITPRLSQWSPFIGKNTRRGPNLYNTEHRKVSKIDGSLEKDCREMTEERLLEALNNLNTKEFNQLVKSILGNSASRLHCKLDKLLAVRDMISRSHEKFKKAFTKLWGCSGGWASCICPHGVVYAMKFVLRAESPRDFVDLLLSFKHLPNIVIVDMANMVVAHGNKRCQGMFSPNSGMVCEPTEENIENASKQKLSISMPWILNEGSSNPDSLSSDNAHPVSRQSIHLCLYDRFHERNVTKKEEVLRRVCNIKQLRNSINTQVAEQLNGYYKRSDRFLNQMTPVNHVYLFRSNMDYYNIELNSAVKARFSVNKDMDLYYNETGRLRARHSSWSTNQDERCSLSNEGDSTVVSADLPDVLPPVVSIDIVSDDEENVDEEVNPETWLEELDLSTDDRHILSGDGWLSDRHVNVSMQLMKKTYPGIGGLQDVITASVNGYQRTSGFFVQIVNLRKSHWVTISNRFSSCGNTIVYDSLVIQNANGIVSYETKLDEAAFQLQESDHIANIEIAKVQQQEGGNDCGLFAIANAACLCAGICPTTMNFQQSSLRRALVQSLENLDIGMLLKTATWTVNDANATSLTSWRFRLYCTCRKIDDGSLMVECTRCKYWYHKHCVSGNVKHPKWICDLCLKKVVRSVTPAARKEYEEIQTVLELLNNSADNRVAELYEAARNMKPKLSLPSDDAIQVGILSLEEYWKKIDSHRKRDLMGITHRHPKFHICFLIVFSESCNDTSTLLSTFLHELTHVIQYVEKDRGTSHGKGFKKIGRRLIKLMSQNRHLLPKAFANVEINDRLVLTARCA